MKTLHLFAAITAVLIAVPALAEDTSTTVTTTKETATTSTEGGSPASASKEVTLPSGTKYVDVVVGTGAEATPGKTVSVHYTGTLTNGSKFDSSKDRGQPFSFPLGGGRVIKGWDQGVAGMKVGGTRKLTIPPDQAYGDRAMGSAIPANSTLLFDVELLDVQ